MNVNAKLPEDPVTTRLHRGRAGRPGDAIFAGLARGAALFVTAVIAAIGVFLLWRAMPALTRNEVNFLTSREWRTFTPDSLAFGVLDLFLVTVFVSAFALFLAMPVALGIAIFITQYAPKQTKKGLGYLVDLLAAVPSVVYGLWGLLVLAPALQPVAAFLHENFGWFFLFSAENEGLVEAGFTIFTAGIVLAVMILPIITAITREVFTQTPTAQVEAALALGATKWEVVRTTVIPFGKSGYVSGSMLGLGRALGETMAIYIVLATASSDFRWSLFEGGQTIASKIASGYAEINNELQAGAYIAAGLVLFVLTFAVNAAARAIVAGKGVH
ncbi:phosphate ABC transporter permease subunit PstC [Hoyosella subflava]|uniref:Phosphate transport system permease protein n=1 Tax=Hoyosella subflava (strain DSM 45089 / JCM 17490 / NBRC 109087 / DQS3-9A1) TaxID=443218 RepID=F6ELB2_HOYSD|nr:phosphate ABC transporter permease subunit PstC [Hoyosella subflava]AEF39204.1 Phosphate ABC transporter permease protein [Hoyosella subflava DQS3-9A1]